VQETLVIPRRMELGVLIAVILAAATALGASSGGRSLWCRKQEADEDVEKYPV
jgi:hypothetical protein